MLDLQRAFPRACTPAEYFQDQPCTIEHLGAPGLFEIALLHRRERAVHHHDADLLAFYKTRKFVDLAFAQISRGSNLVERCEPCLDDVEIDGARESDGLVKPRGGRPFALLGTSYNAPRRAATQIRTHHHCASGRRAVQRRA